MVYFHCIFVVVIKNDPDVSSSNADMIVYF